MCTNYLHKNLKALCNLWKMQDCAQMRDSFKGLVHPEGCKIIRERNKKNEIKTYNKSIIVLKNITKLAKSQNHTKRSKKFVENFEYLTSLY